MKVLFSANRNPHFRTITEYIEQALLSSGCQVIFFEDRDFIVPGRFRKGLLEKLDLWFLNARLAAALRKERPDLLLVSGGERVSPQTLAAARRLCIKSVLWTIDPVNDISAPRIKAARFYDHVFCGGTEMLHYLTGQPLLRPPRWLPFACEPKLHSAITVPPQEAVGYKTQAAFVGSLHVELYPRRLEYLEAASEVCSLGLWGPGGDRLAGKLAKCVRGGQTGYETWTRIYSSAEIVLCLHYKDPAGKLLCNQASPRVFEALACGAFVLCDAQKDVLNMFEDGKHLCVFHSSGELQEKITYYLAHPQERAAIARAGQQEVLAHHTYGQRVTQILESLEPCPAGLDGNAR